MDMDLVGVTMVNSDITDNVTETKLHGVNMFVVAWKLESILLAYKDIECLINKCTKWELGL